MTTTVTHTFRAIFEITDQDATLSTLIAEASGVIDLMARAQGAQLVGDPGWAVTGDRLVCDVPARVMPDEPHLTRGRAAGREDDIARLVNLHWSDGQIGAVLGCSANTVAKVRHRAGIPSAYVRGGRLRVAVEQVDEQSREP